MKKTTTHSESSKQISLKTFLIAGFLFICLTNLVLLTLAREKLARDGPFLSFLFCLDCYLALFILLGHGSFQSYLQRQTQDHKGFLLIYLLPLYIPFLIYAIGTRSLSPLPSLKLLLYLALPTLVASTAQRFAGKPGWQDFIAILLLWLPIDLRWLHDVWPWPQGSLAYSLNSLLATSLGVFLFVGVRIVDQVGYEFHFTLRDFGVALWNFVLFSPLAVIVGLSTGFLSISKHFATLGEFGLSALGILVLIAIPEELLFRGIIQNLMGRVIANSVWALLLTSLIFGASHLNNGPQPDWRYFLLGTIAGLFYGNAYQKTRKLIAPAILHALVDATWRGFFR